MKDERVLEEVRHLHVQIFLWQEMNSSMKEVEC